MGVVAPKTIEKQGFKSMCNLSKKYKLSGNSQFTALDAYKSIFLLQYCTEKINNFSVKKKNKINKIEDGEAINHN